MLLNVTAITLSKSRDCINRAYLKLNRLHVKESFARSRLFSLERVLFSGKGGHGLFNAFRTDQIAKREAVPPKGGHCDGHRRHGYDFLRNRVLHSPRIQPSSMNEKFVICQSFVRKRQGGTRCEVSETLHRVPEVPCGENGTLIFHVQDWQRRNLVTWPQLKRCLWHFPGSVRQGTVQTVCAPPTACI